MHIHNMVCAQQTVIPGVNITKELKQVKYMNTLPLEVFDCIKDVYRELSTPNLLAKCLHKSKYIFPGFYTAGAIEAADRERQQKANYDILQNSKEVRMKKRHKKCVLEDTLAEGRKTQAIELVCINYK
ncbi:hypothetical protein TNCV_3235071 [Trichonephila clavipes]|nr:hypothetical protein TNCV_3235071 [Trichonephila clavipes]